MTHIHMNSHISSPSSQFSQFSQFSFSSVFSSSFLSWKKYLEPEMKKDYFLTLQQFLSDEKKMGKIIYPEEKNIFNAFSSLHFDDIKVVILGQDPYHGENQAHGLSFSVPKSQKKIPPSLKNIFKELASEYSDEKMMNRRENGDLSSWAAQGVFLLNATLTVEAGKAGSHQKKGWEIFTDTIISLLSEKKEKIIFLLWGSFAQTKTSLIDTKKHYVLTAPHPSPLSAYRGFFGCNHFLQTNKILKKMGKKEIEWWK